MATWRVEERQRNLHLVHVELAQRETFEALLISDVHLDHPDCDRRLLKRHLDEALEKNAPVISNGDLLCVMQGPHDKRRTQGKVRPEHDEPGYFSAVIDETVEFLAPYARIISVAADGNHETHVTKHSGIDLTRHIVAGLRARGGENCYHGGYHGFIRFCFRRANQRTSRLLYYHHGAGGGGYATRGALETNKSLAQIRADIYHSGHIHQSLIQPVQYLGVNRDHRIIEDRTLHIITPGYKAAHGPDKTHGFEVEKRMGPRPRGAAWLQFVMAANDTEFKLTAREAI